MSSVLAGAVIAALFLAACGAPDTESDDDEGPLRIAVLPDEAETTLRDRYEPLMARLAADLGREVTLMVPPSYADLVTAFSEGRVDLAYFGGLTFVLARDGAGAIPLVTRDSDTRFTSVFVARGDDGRRSLSDFAGAALAFGSELSTSGHLMPRRYLLEELGTEPEEFFSRVIYSGAHDATVSLVRVGDAELGAVNSLIYHQLIAEGAVGSEELRTVWETPIYPDYVWAVPQHLAPATAARIADVFLDLSVSDDADSEILRSLGAGRFLPADSAAWDGLAEVSDYLGVGQ